MTKNAAPSASDELLALLESGKLPIAKRIARARELIAGGANVNIKGKYGLTPLHYAVWNHERGAVDLAKLLLDAGANANAVSDAKVVPLLSAVEGNDDVAPATIAASLALIELLLGRGARVPKKLALAEHCCASPQVFERMWKLGASPALRDESGRDAIHAVVWAARPALVDLLVAKRVALDTVDDAGKTPLATARELDAPTPKAAKAKQRVIDALVRAGAPETTTSKSTAGFPLAALRAAAAKVKLPASIRDVLTHDLASANDLILRLRRAASAAEAAKLAPALAQVFAAPKKVRAGNMKVKTASFHAGDLHIKGNLDVVAPFVVTGNLVVDGVMADTGPDSWVLVGGHLDVLALNTDGDFAVAGTITARDVVYGYYNDNSLHADVIRARVVIADDHDIDAKVRADVHFDIDRYRQGRGKGVAAQLAKLFVPGVLRADGAVDRDALFASLAKRKPVWLNAR